MRNIRDKGRLRDRDELKQMAQLFTWPRIADKRAAFRCFNLRRTC
jgi:hypothetical protein